MARYDNRFGGIKAGLTKLGRFGRFGRFAKEEDGAMFILAMFLFITLLIFSGLSIDLMRYELQRTRLQSTLDRALLAAAHPDQENDRKGVVLDYFERAGLTNLMDEDDITVIVGPDGTIVTASAIMKVGSPFLSWSGVDYLSAPASGGAAKINQLTEISLVVDVSGSMADQSTGTDTKIEALRKAALEFSNLLLCNPNDPSTSTNCTITKRKTSISLVPYSTQVNVGQTILSKFDRQDAQTDAYCVTFRDGDFKDVRVKPHPDMILEPDKLIRQAAKFYRYGGSYRSTNSDAYLSCHTDSWREVVAFEHSPTDMETKINSLGAQGDTAIDIGMKWGAALLHHETQPVITNLISEGVVHADFANRPYNPGSTASSKFLVLMTDGQNTNHHYLYDGYRTGPSPFWLNTYNGRDIASIRRNVTFIEDGVEVTEPRYLWFYPSTKEYHPSINSNPENWHEEPYGFEGKADCFPSSNGNRCTPLEAPEDSHTSQLNWETFWKLKYTWGFVERFDWLLPKNPDKPSPGYKISNSNNSDNDTAGIRDIDQRLLDQCTAAKDAGITIYTIEMETPDTATDAMQSCASTKVGENGKPKLLHYKVSSSQISAVFKGIASDINKLRLTH
ncbi:pilus assembly protein TadG-related protein [Aliiroseovarius sp. S1339]|uniref:TadE/TadG family type IV pilus assembly protein n=1 Tax=Aliiroseovarius sp. S1339 TaxID=2936990 RepID=UPI0020C0B184|nr:TadE/TadG family type IV pilus assembly protein [Aliiroseovarius sp. S1339]MCK8462524.1 pilus assembly protein TadG-related protein [Aliiroseovarius sp. S1339]